MGSSVAASTSPDATELLKRGTDRQWPEQRDRPAPIGDLDDLTLLDELQQLTGTLAQLSHPDRRHELLAAHLDALHPPDAAGVTLLDVAGDVGDGSETGPREGADPRDVVGHRADMSWFKHHEAPLPATPAEDPAVAIARATWDAWQFAKLDAFTDDLQGVMLRKGEVAHLDVEPVGFVEPRRQPGHWTGRSQGVSIPIVKGIRYRVGASKGTFQQGAEVLTPIDQGRFVVTSTRCLFMGSTRSTEWSYAKLLGYELAGDNRIVFSVSNRQKPSGIVYGDDVELRIEAIVAGALARWSGPDAEHDLLVEMERRYREATAALPRTTVAPGSELPPPVPPTTAS